MRPRPITLAVGILAALGASTVVYRETRPQERDRRALVSHLREMEKAIRVHDAQLWLHVTTSHPVAEGDRAHAATHDAMLRDFERLRHLESLRLTDIQVEVTGDTAVARYLVECAPGRVGAPAPPKAGELRFVRGHAGWEMTAHRLVDR